MMKFDINNLFIAGTTNTTELDVPEIVFAYPAKSNELPKGFNPSPNDFAEGDVILVGPLGEDGLVDINRAEVYEIYLDESCDVLAVRPMDKSRFEWVHKLSLYRPLVKLRSYEQEVRREWGKQRYY